jgi:hypothetical protein
MNSLSNSIRDYFWSHFDELPLDKQLHFASRLWFWEQDPTARQKLDELRSSILPGENVIESLRGIGEGNLLPLRQGSLNVLHLREPFFARYPSLRRTATVLYWGLILDACYETDARSRLNELFPESELQRLYQELCQDRQAVALLSTHAVNFMYLYQRYVKGAEGLPENNTFVGIATDGQLYDMASPLHNQLRIYLLTHTIIGESMFYSRQIPGDTARNYWPVMQTLERILGPNLKTVNLDNKLEFLVCARLLGYGSELESSILDEAGRSLSNEGNFLIDTHNQNPQTSYQSFDKSEHRTLLYLLATGQSEAR